MNQCNLCQQDFSPHFQLNDLVLWKQLFSPTICPKCFAKFKLIKPDQACPQCGRNQLKPQICLDCRRWQEEDQGDVIVNQARLVYNQAAHDYFHNFKMIGDYRLRLVFRQIINDFFRKQHFESCLFIPSSPAHLKQRRFDPVLALYGDLITPSVKIYYVGKTTEQSQNNRQERLNLAQHFQILPKAVARLKKQKHILLLDDIYTTGATLYSLRDALRSQGIEAKLTSFTLAR